MMELIEGKQYLIKIKSGEWVTDEWTVDREGGYFSWGDYGIDDITKIIPLEDVIKAPELQAENERLRESIDAYEKLIEDAPFKLALERIVSIFESGYEAYEEIYYTARDALAKAGKVQEQSE